MAHYSKHFKRKMVQRLSGPDAPSALVGGVIAVALTRGVISIGALVGFVTVLGIAARNGVMLVSHFLHLEHEEGMVFGPELVLRGVGRGDPWRFGEFDVAECVRRAVWVLASAFTGTCPADRIELPTKLIVFVNGSSLMYLPCAMNENTFVFPRLFPAFFATMLLVGCGAAPTKETNKLADSGQPTTTKPDVETTAIVRSKGLADAANDPIIVKAFKDVLACPWNAEEDRFDAECPALVAFGENENLLGDDADKGVSTLLNLLDDPDEKVRSLALDKMPFSGAKAYTDKALASRILAQAERETTERCASNFGSLVGRIDLKATGLIGPVKRLVETHPNVAVRKSILGSILYTNDKDRNAVDLVLAGLKSDNKDIRYTCVLNLSKAQGSFAADVCPVYVTMLDDSSPDVVGLSAQNLGYVGKCTGQIDALLAFANRRAAAGGEKLFLIANALGNLCDNAATSEAQKKEAAKVAKAFALGKNDSTVRTDALYGVTSCDPAGAEAFLKGLLKDPDERVKKSAQERLGKLKKK